MDALLIYIDDWLSSKKIEAMDADEERGYFRLLLRAAKEQDCGLPNDPRILSIWSKLGLQWNKPTKDKTFRFPGITSGSKMLECFFEKDGRLYNRRLLDVFEDFVARQESARKASRARWEKHAPAYANGSNSHSVADTVPDMRSVSANDATRVGRSIGNGSSVVFPEGGPGGNLPDWRETLAAIREPFPDADGIIAERIVFAALRAKSTADDGEIAQAVRATFKRRVQKSPGLWLQTVPAFLKNGAPKSREYHQPVCLICQDTWRVLRAGITEKPGWVELPESELYEPCECQKAAKEARA